MKLHRNLVNEVALTLQNIFTGNRYADKALEHTLKSHPQWGSRDRRFVAEAVYDIVRSFRLYAEVAGNEKNFWFITAVWMVDKNIVLPDWQELRNVDPEQVRKHLERLRRDPRLHYSYPDWLWQLCSSELGDDRWLEEAAALHVQAEVYVRTNTLRTNKEQLKEKFRSEKNALVEVAGSDDALKLQNRENIFRHPLFLEGWFEVQDAGSQAISGFTGARPGEFVIDACAGAGGKTLHLAALMRNKGRIIALDVEQRKLEELKKRSRRAGVHIVETRLIDQQGTIASLAGKGDRVLLDVPCSGTGVLKRNPDAKWKLSPEIIERTRTIQGSILRDYSVMLKPGGTLVYSTCSILPSENEKQVETFLAEHPRFRLEEERHIWPSEGADGFYMARLTTEA